MTAYGRHLKTGMACLLTIWALTLPALAADTKAHRYPMTIDVLTELHAAGWSKWHQLKAYELKALNENLDGMADLFAAMAASQPIATSRVHHLLAGFGIHPAGCTFRPRMVAGTRANLRRAIEMELLDTDRTFPEALDRVTGEGHRQAIRWLRMTIAVKGHHRDDLESLHAYTGHFFGMLSARINQKKIRYFVCRLTGAVILNKLPAACPPSAYVELVEFEPPGPMATCRPTDDVARFG